MLAGSVASAIGDFRRESRTGFFARDERKLSNLGGYSICPLSFGDAAVGPR